MQSPERGPACCSLRAALRNSTGILPPGHAGLVEAYFKDADEVIHVDSGAVRASAAHD